MALQAGRVGVHPDDVDIDGHIKGGGGSQPTIDVTGASNYSPSKTYEVGETCIYNGIVWTKIGARESGVTPSKGISWSEINLTVLNSNLTDSNTISLSSVNSDIKGQSSQRIEVVGKTCILYLASVNTAYATKPHTSEDLFTFDSKYAPKSQVVFMTSGGGNVKNLAITTTGHVKLITGESFNVYELYGIATWFI